MDYVSGLGCDCGRRISPPKNCILGNVPAHPDHRLCWPGNRFLKRRAGSWLVQASPVRNFRTASGLNRRKGTSPRLFETMTFEHQQSTYGRPPEPARGLTSRGMRASMRAKGTDKMDIMVRYVSLGAALYAIACTSLVPIRQAPIRNYPCNLFTVLSLRGGMSP